MRTIELTLPIAFPASGLELKGLPIFRPGRSGKR
jgi:hypothetical protein